MSIYSVRKMESLNGEYRELGPGGNQLSNSVKQEGRRDQFSNIV
jgi:hypothetical protein